MLSKTIILSDTEHYLAVSKPSGLLSQASKNEGEAHLIDQLDPRLYKSLHLLTRIDRPVSGLCLLSKSKSFSKHYLNLQSMGKVNKSYLALVEKKLILNNETIRHLGLHDKKRHKTHITKNTDHKDKMSLVSQMNTLLVLDNYSLISVSITAGKFHQIRAQLSALGHPIKGDVKYGARRKNKDRSIHLHSAAINFENIDGQAVEITAGLPKNDDLWSLIHEKMINSNE